MGQKVNPIGLRLGITRGWESNWYGGKKFENKLVEDVQIRNYINARLQKASVSKIYIERTLKLVTITIHTARPGLIIGKDGGEVKKLNEELKKITGKEIQINIFSFPDAPHPLYYRDFRKTCGISIDTNAKRKYNSYVCIDYHANQNGK